jgi:hypothetical protein
LTRQKLLETISITVALQRQIYALATKKPGAITTSSLIKFNIWLGARIKQICTAVSSEEIQKRAQELGDVEKSILAKLSE